MRSAISSSSSHPKRTASRNNWWALAALCCRLLAGGIFMLAGLAKLAAPGSFAATLLAYNVLPVTLIAPFTLALPLLEVLVGLLLVLGLFTRAAAAVAIALLVAFMAALGQALLRGLSLKDCGCFGGVAAAVPLLAPLLGGADAGPADLVRDAIYALLAAVALFGPPAPLSLDRWLRGGGAGEP